MVVARGARAVGPALGLRGDATDGADERQEPAAALVFLAGMLAVLSTPRFAGLLDEPEVDGLPRSPSSRSSAAVAYAFVGYFVLGAALKLGSGAPYRLARHVVAYACAPLALGAAPPLARPARCTTAATSSAPEARTRAREGPSSPLLELGFALWALGLLVAGARYALRLPWAHAAAACDLAATLAALAVWVDRFQ